MAQSIKKSPKGVLEKMRESEIAISVIMSVYNENPRYLDIAVQSILNQAFHDFEFIMINDGSDAKVKEQLESYTDERIVLIHNADNYGLTKSLNIGLDAAKGKYIARMDSDDYSCPDRLKLQYQYMEDHHEIDILGAWVKAEGKVQKSGGCVPTEWRYTRMLFDNVGIYHPTAFIRKSFLDKNHLRYDERMKKAQDYALWTQCLSLGKMYVFPKVLLDYRVHDMQISKKNLTEQNYYNLLIRENLLEKLALDLSVQELGQFRNINQVQLSAAQIDAFFLKILNANKAKKIFHEKMLAYELNTKWIRYILQTHGREKIDFLRGRFLGRVFNLKYYIYMLSICLYKQDLLHHSKETLR